jgi:hypothetical protein
VFLFGAVYAQSRLGTGSGVGREVSAATILRVARDLDREVGSYHDRAIEDHYRYLFFRFSHPSSGDRVSQYGESFVRPHGECLRRCVAG